MRRGAAQPDVLMRNRYVEENPVLQPPESLMYVRRPAARRWLTLAAGGPIRSIYHQPGAFSDDLFAAAYDTLYRVTSLGVATSIATSLFAPDSSRPLSFA